MARKILFVDDNPIDAQIILHKLRNEGYEVDHVDTGAKGLTAVREGEYSLILLDIVMPGVDGFHVLEHIKEDEDLSHIPVVMLTSTGQKGNVLKSYELGAVEYLTKPIKPNELAMRLKQILLSSEEFGRKPS